MSDDIRTLLTSKSRAKVPPRSASLKSNRPPSSEEKASTEIKDEQDSSAIDEGSIELQRLKEELDSLPKVGKRLAVHLEQEVRADLIRLCDSQEITPETFIESACAWLHSKPELIEEIVADAKLRLRTRKRAGLLRRTLAMVQKYSDS